MRKGLFAMLAAMVLSGCVSMLDNAYDEQARNECDNGAQSDRSGCHDRVDQNRRERDR